MQGMFEGGSQGGNRHPCPGGQLCGAERRGRGAGGACTGFIKVICCILLTIKSLMPADA